MRSGTVRHAVLSAMACSPAKSNANSHAPCRACDEASGRSYDVFISHAGPQKGNFAAWLRRELQRHGISAFLDEGSLRLGDAAAAETEAALRSCSIVVVVLTPDFVRSSDCMEELHWALHPSQPHPAQPQQSPHKMRCDQQLAAHFSRMHPRTKSQRSAASGRRCCCLCFTTTVT
jgi:TIR domain